MQFENNNVTNFRLPALPKNCVEPLHCVHRPVILRAKDDYVLVSLLVQGISCFVLVIMSTHLSPTKSLGISLVARNHVKRSMSPLYLGNAYLPGLETWHTVSFKCDLPGRKKLTQSEMVRLASGTTLTDTLKLKYTLLHAGTCGRSEWYPLLWDNFKYFYVTTFNVLGRLDVNRP